MEGRTEQEGQEWTLPTTASIQQEGRGGEAQEEETREARLRAAGLMEVRFVDPLLLCSAACHAYEGILLPRKDITKLAPTYLDTPLRLQLRSYAFVTPT